MSIKYITLPIYSVPTLSPRLQSTDSTYIFQAAGAAAQASPMKSYPSIFMQKIYHRNITPEPANSILTGNHIIENLTVF